MRDDLRDVLQPFIDRHMVTYMPAFYDFYHHPELATKYANRFGNRDYYESMRKLGGDNAVSQKCFELFGNTTTHMAFFDSDEYFTPVSDRVANLADVMMLPEFRNFSGIAFHWRLFSYAGHVLRPSDGSVRHYQACNAINRHIKTIARVSGIRGIQNAHFLEHLHPVDSDRGCAVESGDRHFCQVRKLWDERFSPVPPRYFQLNHYFARSYEDFILKSLRGIYHESTQYRQSGDFVAHNDCLTIECPWTSRMIARTKVVMDAFGWKNQARFLLPPTPAAVLRAYPFFADTIEAVRLRKHFDAPYFLDANRGNPGCTLSGDLFLNCLKQCAGEAKCKYRFVDSIGISNLSSSLE
jgi:hypothetical protein